MLLHAFVLETWIHAVHVGQAVDSVYPLSKASLNFRTKTVAVIDHTGRPFFIVESLFGYFIL
jgi:hypothetical protein